MNLCVPVGTTLEPVCSNRVRFLSTLEPVCSNRVRFLPVGTTLKPVCSNRVRFLSFTTEHEKTRHNQSNRRKRTDRSSPKARNKMCDDGAAMQSFWALFAGGFLAATLLGLWRAEKLAGQEQEQREKPVGRIVSPLQWKHNAAATVSARRTAEQLRLREPGMQDSSRRASTLQSESSSPDHARQRPATKSTPASSGPGFTRKPSGGASSAQGLPRKSSPRPTSARRPSASRSWGSLASSSRRNSREGPDHADHLHIGATTPEVRARTPNVIESKPADLNMQLARGLSAWQDANRPEQRAGPTESHSSLLGAALLRCQQERRYSWESDESDADDKDDHFIRAKPAGVNPAKQRRHEKLCSSY